MFLKMQRSLSKYYRSVSLCVWNIVAFLWPVSVNRFCKYFRWSRIPPTDCRKIIKIFSARTDIGQWRFGCIYISTLRWENAIRPLLFVSLKTLSEACTSATSVKDPNSTWPNQANSYSNSNGNNNRLWCKRRYSRWIMPIFCIELLSSCHLIDFFVLSIANSVNDLPPVK